MDSQLLLDGMTKNGREEWILAGKQRISVKVVRNRRARRYIMRVGRDGVARVTIPRGGSLAEGRSFVERHVAWLEKQIHKVSLRPRGPAQWTFGTKILFRGEWVVIEAEAEGKRAVFRLGDERVSVPVTGPDLRPGIEKHLFRMAGAELARTVSEYASLHQLTVRRITVRNQTSRWGSCSHRGTISLNWRLIQVPPSVRDYVVVHELMHLRHMNHSARFWGAVAAVYPNYHRARQWLKEHAMVIG